MKLRFVWIGKTKSQPIRSLIEDYVDRISRFSPVELVEIRDKVHAQNDNVALAAREGEEILARIRSDQFVVLLDEKGTELDSEQFARMIEGHQLAGTKQMTFLIGGHAGVSGKVRERADYTMAFGRMTLTHEMARALLTEQVYRAFTIIKNLPYKR